MLFSETEYFSNRFEHLEKDSPEIRNIYFEDCTFSHCNFSDLKLVGCHFASCNFISSDLSNIKFSRTKIRQCFFSQCKMIGLDWTTLTDPSSPHLEKCKADFCNFSTLKIKKSSFANSSLKDCDFTQCDLCESDFRESILTNSRFFQTDLRKCDFRQASQYQINPMENKLKGAQFSGAEALSLLNKFGILIT